MDQSRFSRYSSTFARCDSGRDGSYDANFRQYRNFSLNDNSDSLPRVIQYNQYNRKTNQVPDEPPLYKDIHFSKCLRQEVVQSNEILFDDNRPLGLPNSKSYCYMNSIIQSLSHCIDFINAVLYYRLNTDESKMRCKKEDSALISMFFQLMNDIGYRNQNTVEASSQKFQDMHDSFTEFSDGEQDADEYLQFLLNKLNDVTKSEPKKIIKKKSTDKEVSFKQFLEENDSFATRLFCGQMNNELRCCHCSFSKPSYQVFWVLPLPITVKEENEPEISLESCLKSMLTVDKLDGKGCSKCHKQNCILTRTEITHWPIYLIIHLKRHIQSGFSYKSSTKITLPINETISMSPDSKYSLLGVIDHIGTTFTGHYVAKFRDLNERNLWWRFNDTIVSKIANPDEDIITSNTTTYFFSKPITESVQ